MWGKFHVNSRYLLPQISSGCLHFPNQSLDKLVFHLFITDRATENHMCHFFSDALTILANISALHLFGGSFLHLGPGPVKSSWVLIIQGAAQPCDNGALVALNTSQQKADFQNGDLPIPCIFLPFFLLAQNLIQTSAFTF